MLLDVSKKAYANQGPTTDPFNCLPVRHLPGWTKTKGDYL